MTDSRRMAATVLAMGLVVVGCTVDATGTPGSPANSLPGSVAGLPSLPQSPSEPTSEPTRALAWTAEPFGGQVDAIVEDRGQLVAVGRDADGLASWRSTDGVTWVRHDVPDPSFIEGMLEDFGAHLYAGTRMGQMTRVGDTLFSIGTFSGPIDFYRPVAWRSPDGVSWEFIQSESEFYSYGAVTDVTSFHDTLIAARAVGLIGPVYSLWTWDAERSWRESSLRSTSEGTVTIITMLDAAVSDGGIFAIGNVARPTDAPQDEWPTDPVAWRSDDGERWNEIALPDDAALAYRIAPAPDGGFSVLGEGIGGTATVWHTTNGTRWTSTDLGVCPSPEACDLYGLTRAGHWLVATLRVKQDGVVWLSRDGLDWARQETPAAPFPDGPIAELGGEVFVFANRRSPEWQETVLFRGHVPS